MPVLKTYINGSWENVSGFGNNADTLDGKHASEFASATDVEALQTKIDNIENSTNDFVPTDHASPDTTYGIGTSDNYGHIKLSDATDSISGTSDGVAATPAAVKAAYDLANSKADDDHSHSAMKGASQYGAGAAGFVPAPSAGNQNAFLRGDGTWATPTSGGGTADSATKLATAREIDGISFDGSTNVTRYATCSTGASTRAKTASVTAGTFKLATGARVTVKFSNANTAGSATLNINNTGAKSIYWHGSALPSSQYWEAGAVLDFVYNGSAWELVGVAKDNSGSGGASSLSDLGVNASATELNYMDGVTSNVQTQLNNKAPAYTYGTSDLTAGTSTLATGTLYFVYE